MDKLLKFLADGEGHTIFMTDKVIEALKEANFSVKKDKHNIHISKDGQDSYIYLTMKPTKKPTSKYDVTEWHGTDKDGVHDLELIKAVICWMEKVMGNKYNNGDYMGRGFQYRAYYEWCYNNGFGQPVKEAK